MEKNIYDEKCPLLYAMEIFSSKWKIPILWYLAENEKNTLRYRELQKKVRGITQTMLTKSLKELERDEIIFRKQFNTIPPTVEYSLTERGKSLIPALKILDDWARKQMNL